MHSDGTEDAFGWRGSEEAFQGHLDVLTPGQGGLELEPESRSDGTEGAFG
jgi:hypothetical protein